MTRIQYVNDVTSQFRTHVVLIHLNELLCTSLSTAIINYQLYIFKYDLWKTKTNNRRLRFSPVDVMWKFSFRLVTSLSARLDIQVFIARKRKKS